MNKLRAFWLGSGVVLAILAAAGFWLVAAGRETLPSQYIIFETPQNIFHAALALGAFALAFAPIPERTSRSLAIGVDTLYLALAVLGFLSPRLFGFPARLGLDLRFELGENLAHLALGLWGAYVGTND